MHGSYKFRNYRDQETILNISIYGTQEKILHSLIKWLYVQI